MLPFCRNEKNNGMNIKIFCNCFDAKYVILMEQIMDVIKGWIGSSVVVKKKKERKHFFFFVIFLY